MHCNAQVVRAEYLDATENIGGRGLWFFPKGGSKHTAYNTNEGSTCIMFFFYFRRHISSKFKVSL